MLRPWRAVCVLTFTTFKISSLYRTDVFPAILEALAALAPQSPAHSANVAGPRATAAPLHAATPLARAARTKAAVRLGRPAVTVKHVVAVIRPVAPKAAVWQAQDSAVVKDVVILVRLVVVTEQHAVRKDPSVAQMGTARRVSL